MSSSFMLRVVCALAVLAVCATAAAAEPAEDGEVATAASASASASADDPSADPWLLYVEGGADALGGRGFALVEPGLEYRGRDLHLALGAPLRVDVARAEPGLRTEDADERSDAGALLRRLSYGEEGEAFRLVAGTSLVTSFGAGSIVRELRPSVDPDHPRAGAQLGIDLGVAQLDALASDVLSPRVFAARLQLPVGDWAGLPDRLVVGGTYALDPEAQAAAPLSVTAARNVEAKTASASLAGADVQVVIIRAERFALAPYVEAAALTSGGAGLHAGASMDLRLGSGAEDVLGLRAEWRRLGEGYVPEYFDPYYEVERHAYPTVKSPPKLAYARGSPAGDGLAAEARLGIQETLAMTARLSGRGHGPISAEVGAEVPSLLGTSAAVLVARRGAVTPADVLDLEGETWLLAEARAPLTRNLYLSSSVARGFHVGDDGAPAPLFEAYLGLGAITGF